MTTNKQAILMFIDDSDADITIIQRSFERKKIKFAAYYFNSANAAWEHLNDSQQPLPDMIFLDRNLDGSDMGGDELLEKIRGKENTLRFIGVQVVMLSGMELTEADKKRYTDLNVDAYLPKPLLAENVINMIERSQDYYFQIMRQIMQGAA